LLRPYIYYSFSTIWGYYLGLLSNSSLYGWSRIGRNRHIPLFGCRGLPTTHLWFGRNRRCHLYRRWDRRATHRTVFLRWSLWWYRSLLALTDGFYETLQDLDLIIG
jgi:hypothetical protein